MPCGRTIPGHWIASANACRRMSDSRSASFFQCLKVHCSESGRPAHEKQNIPEYTSALAGRFSAILYTGYIIGMSLPIWWALMHEGVIAAPDTTFSMVQWHAHEMFFASAGRFWRFPADCNQELGPVRGYSGYALMFLAAAWLFERVGMWFQEFGRHCCSGSRTTCS